MAGLAIKTWVFNPELRSKIVIISGLDEAGEKVNIRGVVREAEGSKLLIKAIDFDDLHEFYLNDFYDEGLKLSVWDTEPTEYEMPESYWE